MCIDGSCDVRPAVLEKENQEMISMSSPVRVVLAVFLLVTATTAAPADGSRRSWHVYHGIGATFLAM